MNLSSCSDIGSIGAKALSDALKKNNSLKILDLTCNFQMNINSNQENKKESFVTVFSEVFKTNTSLQLLGLNNVIGDEKEEYQLETMWGNRVTFEAIFKNSSEWITPKTEMIKKDDRSMEFVPKVKEREN